MGLIWGPPRAGRTQVGPILVPWSLLSGKICSSISTELNPCQAKFIFQKKIIFAISHHFSKLRWHRQLKLFHMENKDLHMAGYDLMMLGALTTLWLLQVAKKEFNILMKSTDWYNQIDINILCYTLKWKLLVQFLFTYNNHWMKALSYFNIFPLNA